jgi:hypothetical protein
MVGRRRISVKYILTRNAAFVQGCASLGHPVKSVTIVAKNGGERLSLGISGSVVVGLAALSLLVL